MHYAKILQHASYQKNMKLAFFIVCFISSINCFGQSLHDSLVKPLAADTSKPTLYCGNGLETLIYSKADKSFEKQYKIRYKIVGCIQIYSIKEMADHNKAIAQFLDRKFNPKWREGLRPDVFGVTN